MQAVLNAPVAAHQFGDACDLCDVPNFPAGDWTIAGRCINDPNMRPLDNLRKNANQGAIGERRFQIAPQLP